MKEKVKLYDYRVLFCVVVCVSVVFGPLIFADFVGIDDKVNIIQNPNISSITWKDTARIWKESYFHMYIPLTYSLWAIIAAISRAMFLGKLVGGVFHFFNILVHIFNTFLVYYLLRSYFGKRFSCSSDALKIMISAGLGALVFALHPIQVEAVSWVTGMKDLLSGFFSFSAILIFFKFYTNEYLGFRKKFLFSLLLLPVYAAALVSKPSSVIVPVLLVILCSDLSLGGLKNLFLILFPWFMLSLLFVILTKNVQPVGNDARMAYEFYKSPLIAADSLVFFLRKIVFPDVFIIDYGRSPFYVLHSFWRYLSVSLIAIVCFALSFVPSKRFWFLTLALFIAGVLPVLGFVPFEFQHTSGVADRYAYLAVLALSFVVTHCLLTYDFKKILSIIIGISLIFCLKSIIQVGYWKNSSSLMGHVLMHNPKSVTANVNYCIAMMIHGNYVAAIQHCRAALEIDPGDYNAHYNLPGLSPRPPCNAVSPQHNFHVSSSLYNNLH